jgi:hypothetical protein
MNSTLGGVRVAAACAEEEGREEEVGGHQIGSDRSRAMNSAKDGGGRLAAAFVEEEGKEEEVVNSDRIG